MLVITLLSVCLLVRWKQLLLLLRNEVLILSLYHCRLNHGLLILLLLFELNLRRYRLVFKLTSAFTLDNTLFLFSVLQTSLLKELLKFFLHCFCHLDVHVFRCVYHFLDLVQSFLGFYHIFFCSFFGQGLIVDAS